VQETGAFAVTYSDTLSDVNLTALLAFHHAHGAAASVVTTQYPVRFRILGIREGESLVRAFAPKPIIDTAAVNGGFYLFNQAVWNPIYGLDGQTPLEVGFLEGLVARLQLHAFEHRGAWQHGDSERDIAILGLIAQQIAASGHHEHPHGSA
jgi:glucose-1-phosphate cytidylyltransferase